MQWCTLSSLILFFAFSSSACYGLKDYCDTEWGRENFNCDFCTTYWEETTAKIRSDEYEIFVNAVQPYLNASNILYDYRYRQKSDISGWDVVKIHYPQEADHYGMHAIAWRNQAEPQQMMVASRGTWDVLPWGPEGKSDICAGWYLLKYMKRPDFCDDFTEDEMDYYTQLEQFIEELREEQEGEFCLSFTGHSLGSFLANAMSVAWNAAMPAYSFSGPGIIWMAENIIPIPLDFERSRNVMNIFNQNDPAVEVHHFLTNQTGWLLRFDNEDVSIQCRRCIESGALDYTDITGDCNICMVEEHELYVMERYMYTEHRVPEQRFRFPLIDDNFLQHNKWIRL